MIHIPVEFIFILTQNNIRNTWKDSTYISSVEQKLERIRKRHIAGADKGPWELPD
jgi:hypothetical protein